VLTIISIKDKIRKQFPQYEVVFSAADTRKQLIAYAVNKDKIIGKGSTSIVYAALPININQMKLSYDRHLAAKKFKDINQYVIVERFDKTDEVTGLGLIPLCVDLEVATDLIPALIRT